MTGNVNNQHVLVTGSTISNNIAYSNAFQNAGNGGGVYMTGGNLNIRNVVFSANVAHANYVNAVGFGGGALSQWGGVAIIQDSIFSDNYAVKYGAALYIRDGITKLRNVRFQNNNGNFGVIFIHKAPTVYFADCKMIGNIWGSGTNLYFSAFTGSFFRVNMKDSDFQESITLSLPSGYPKTCSEAATLCSDAGLPAHDCTDGIAVSDGVNCTISPLYPYISSISSDDCVDDNNNVYHVNGCPVSGATITIHGLNFQQSGNHTASVVLGSKIPCVHSLWSSTKILCTFFNGDSNNLLVTVTAANGKSNTQTQEKLVSYAPPELTSLSPNPSTCKGGTITTIYGKNFGTSSSTIKIRIGNTIGWNRYFTEVTWLSATTLQAKIPAGSGENHAVEVKVGNQDSTNSLTFSYNAPTISSVTPLLSGGVMLINGFEFAHVATSKIKIVAKDRSMQSEVTCLSPQRNSYNELQCTYNFPGVEGECQEKDIIVRIDGLESNLKQLCYSFVSPGFVGLLTERSVTEGAGFDFQIRLRLSPISGNVVLKISSSSSKCSVKPRKVTFTGSTWDQSRKIEIETEDDRRYFAKSTLTYQCILTFETETSTDTAYSLLNAVTSVVKVISSGCGAGEYLGIFNRKNNGKECVCGVRFYLSKSGKCRDCPPLTSTCNKIGLKVPPVSPGFWRQDPKSNDIDKIHFYPCPNTKACSGGNNDTSQCALGYSNKFPLCATCEDGYILQYGNICSPCPGAYNNGKNGLTTGQIASFVVLWVLALTLFVKYFLSPDKKNKTVRKLEQVGDYIATLKLFVGFAQCFSLLPFTFDIPWPKNVEHVMHIFEVTSLDFFSFFGDTINCTLQSHFLQIFEFHMLLPWFILLSLLTAFCIAAIKIQLKKWKSRKSSAVDLNILKSRLYTSTCLIVYTLYTGLATRIFRFFKCRLIQGKWYLIADYRHICFESTWNEYAVTATVCGIIYVIGIPLAELLILYCNRRRLYTDGSLKERFGTFYLNYKPNSYYFDVLDLMRRLVLTGGLIIFGGESISQTFLGIVICLFWLLVLAYKKPYNSASDNFLAILMALHLVITMVTGMALKAYSMTPTQNEYQNVGFGLIIISTTCVVTLLSFYMFFANFKSLKLVNRIVRSWINNHMCELRSERSKNLSDIEKTLEVPAELSSCTCHEKTRNNNLKPHDKHRSRYVFETHKLIMHSNGVNIQPQGQ